jgi:zinc protease
MALSPIPKLADINIGSRAVALAAVIAFAFSPTAGAKVFSPESFTLDNGMQVVVVSNHRAPVVTHMVWYRAGAMDEAGPAPWTRRRAAPAPRICWNI